MMRNISIWTAAWAVLAAAVVWLFASEGVHPLAWAVVGLGLPLLWASVAILFVMLRVDDTINRPTHETDG